MRDEKIIAGIPVEQITVQDCLDYLKVDDCDGEDLELIRGVEMFLMAARSFIQNYLRHDFQYYIDTYGETPKEFSIALLLLVAHWYENRQITAGKYVSPKGVPFTITTILDMHRGWL